MFVYGFEFDREIPVVPEVIDVVHDIAGIAHGLVQPHLGGEREAVVFVRDLLGEIEALGGWVERISADREPVQVIVPPTERLLDRGVDLDEQQIGAKLEATPDDGLGIVERDSDGEGCWLRAWRAAQAWPGADFLRFLASEALDLRDHLIDIAQLTGLAAGDDLLELAPDLLIRLHTTTVDRDQLAGWHRSRFRRCTLPGGS